MGIPQRITRQPIPITLQSAFGLGASSERPQSQKMALSGFIVEHAKHSLAMRLIWA